MIRIILVILAALLTGAIIHISTIFAIPHFSTNDIWHRVMALGPIHRIITIKDQKEAITLSEDLDPFFVYGICRTDVQIVPTLLSGRIPGDFWSLNYVDRVGQSQFSLTNQNAESDVSIVLATRGQQRLLSEQPGLIKETAIVINATDPLGLLLLRVFIASEQERKRVADAINRLECVPLWAEGTFEPINP